MQIYKTVGWRVIATLAAGYGLVYAYERLNWNNRTKEKELKKQIQKHLTGKLNQVSQGVTMSCENQVSRLVFFCHGSIVSEAIFVFVNRSKFFLVLEMFKKFSAVCKVWLLKLSKKWKSKWTNFKKKSSNRIKLGNNFGKLSMRNEPVF